MTRVICNIACQTLTDHEQEKTEQWNSERDKLKKEFNELNTKATKLKEQADEWKKNSVRSDAFVNERDELLQAKVRIL